jgi:hypothetical protein
VCVNLGAPACGLAPGDVFVEGRAEEALPAIAKLLGGYPIRASRTVSAADVTPRSLAAAPPQPATSVTP